MKDMMQGQVLGAVVKMPSWMPAFHTGVPGFSPARLTSAVAGKQQVMAQTVESLPIM